LQHSVGDQDDQIRCQRAQQRCGKEEADPDQQQPPMTEAVASRAAEQQQRTQGQQVSADDP